MNMVRHYDGHVKVYLGSIQLPATAQHKIA